MIRIPETEFITKDFSMKNSITTLLDQAENGRVIALHGNISLRPGKQITAGKFGLQPLIPITLSDLPIDGGDATIFLETDEIPRGNSAIFHIPRGVKGVRLRNLHLKVKFHGPKASQKTIVAIHNEGENLSVENCTIEMFAEEQVNLIGFLGRGDQDTMNATCADCTSLNGNVIRIHCVATDEHIPAEVCGLRIQLANSVSVTNNFIHVTMLGKGDLHRAIGMETDGKYGRYIGNNIKAGGMHPAGMKLEQATAIGMINGGMYNLISSNNIVGERGGKCIGLENRGPFANIASNKILSTHSVFGRTILNIAPACLIQGNIVTSTAKNARLIEQRANSCIISHNMMEVCLSAPKCVTGCAIYIPEHCIKNNISDNTIRNVYDCAIFAPKNCGVMERNTLCSFPRTIPLIDADSPEWKRRFSEEVISSLLSEEDEA